MSRGLLVVVECGGGKENSMTKMRSRVTHASIWVSDVDDCLCCKTYNCYGHRGGMLKLKLDSEAGDVVTVGAN